MLYTEQKNKISSVFFFLLFHSYYRERTYEQSTAILMKFKNFQGERPRTELMDILVGMINVQLEEEKTKAC